MFDNLVESSGVKKGRTGLFFAVTAAVWLALLTTAIVLTIVLFDAKLNADFEKQSLLVAAAPPPPPPPPPPPSSTAPTPTKVTPTPVVQQGFVAQKEPPKEIKPPSARPPVAANASAAGVAGGVPGGEIGGEIGGVPGGVVGGVPGGVPGAPPPPPPTPEPPKVEPPKPPSITRVSGGVLQGKATRRPSPAYPAMAKAAGIEGSVVVEVTVSESGQVISARAVSGHPLLRDAAVSAARGWAFSPTLLSGVPVKVIGTISFNFKKT